MRHDFFCDRQKFFLRKDGAEVGEEVFLWHHYFEHGGVELTECILYGVHACAAVDAVGEHEYFEVGVDLPCRLEVFDRLVGDEGIVLGETCGDDDGIAGDGQFFDFFVGGFACAVYEYKVEVFFFELGEVGDDCLGGGTEYPENGFVIGSLEEFHLAQGAEGVVGVGFQQGDFVAYACHHGGEVDGGGGFADAAFAADEGYDPGHMGCAAVFGAFVSLKIVNFG